MVIVKEGVEKKQLVTVYIATHNRLSMLKSAVDSVLCQDYKPIEIIVVDDGSSDGTYDWLKDQQALGHLSCLRNETPQGACHARNRAIFAAQGEFITGLDDDDEFTVGRVKHLINHYHDKYSCVASSMLERREDGVIHRQNDTGHISLEKLLHSNCIGNQVLTRTARLKEIGGFDEDLPAFQDFDAWVRLVSSYGPAYKTSSMEYIWNTTSSTDRISHDNRKKVAALNIFKEKHFHLMNQLHVQSMSLLEMKMADGKVSPLKLFRSLNHENWKSALAIFVMKNYPGLKFRLDSLRESRN